MSYTVLIVDDSRLARMAAAKLVGTLRPTWKRLEAAAADEALAVVKQGAADIVLLDFNMPGRDGLDLAAELRDLKPTLPVALISANHQHEIVSRAGELGATFLPKPVSQQALGTFLEAAAQRLEGKDR